MFKLCFVLLIAILSLLPHLSNADCCGKPSLAIFDVRDKPCEYFGGWSVGPGTCEIGLCGDGEPLTRGTYCGKGPCNIFGCNCDGGCRHGDAVKNFKTLNGDKVYNVYEYSPSL